MGFRRQEYWSGVPCLPPGNLPDPGIKPRLLLLLHWQVGSLSLAPSGKLLFQALTAKCPALQCIVASSHQRIMLMSCIFPNTTSSPLEGMDMICPLLPWEEMAVLSSPLAEFLDSRERPHGSVLSSGPSNI